MRRRALLGLAAGTVASAGCLSRPSADSERVPVGSPTSGTQQADSGEGATIVWRRRYGPDGEDETRTPGTPGMDIRAVAAATDDRLYFGGHRSHPESGQDGLLLQTGPQGRINWYRRYGGKRRDGVTSLVPTDDGGYLVVGYNGEPGEGTRGEAPDATPVPTRRWPWIGKVSATGAVQWQTAIDTAKRATVADAVQLGDGRIAAAGEIIDGDGHAGWLVMLDAAGQLLRTKQFHSESSGPVRTMSAAGRPQFQDFFTSICRRADGGLVLGGENNRGGWIVGTDTEGRTEWTVDLEYPRDVVGDVARTQDGGFIATGRLYERDGPDQHTVTDTRNPSDLYLLRLSATGDPRWLQAYNGGWNEKGSSVTQTMDGGFIASGGSVTHRDTRLFLVKTDATGHLDWSERVTTATTAGGAAQEPWEIPLYGYDVVEVERDEYVVAAGYMFFKFAESTASPSPS